MNDTSSTFEELATRASHGDTSALMRLRCQLGPHMERIVRRALRTAPVNSPLTRQIWAAGQELGLEPGELDSKVGRVADRLGDNLARNLRETAICYRGASDTVCA
jgi:hypothetical protein